MARDYQLDVRVLEAGHIGWGASGRNGGFCSIGGTSLDLRHLLETYGVDNVRAYYQSQVDAVDLVAQIISAERIDTPMQGSSELEVAHSPKAFVHLQQLAKQQRDLLGLDVRSFSADEFRERYFDTVENFGASRLRPTFGLHPMRYIRGLAAAAVQRGARLHADSEVLRWEKDGARHRLITSEGTLHAGRVVFATNGFMPEQLNDRFRGIVLPLISAIIVTKPLTDAELAEYRWQTEDPSINSRELLNYFRLLPDRRFLFGGRGHSTGAEAAQQTIRSTLHEQMIRQWPAWRDVDVEYFWHGLICMTRRQTACIGRLEEEPGVFFAFGYHGNGVNTATWSGKQLADWLGNSALNATGLPDTIPVLMRGLSRRFPFPAMRLNYLRVALFMKKLQDRFG
jgi:glycine/D-amino acid oxidase-like deaminating enzyme